MRRIFPVLLLLTILSCQDLADLKPSQTETYVRFLGDPGNNFGVTLAEDANANLILLGNNQNGTSRKSYIIRTDSYGNQDLSFGQNGVAVFADMESKDLQIDANGYYVIGDRIQDSTMVFQISDLQGNVSEHVITRTDLGGGSNSTLKSKALFLESSDEIIGLAYIIEGNDLDMVYFEYSVSGQQIVWSEKLDDRNYTPGRSLVRNKVDFKYNWVATTTEARGFKGGADEPTSGDIPIPLNTAVDIDINANNNALGGIGNLDNDLFFFELSPSGGQLQFLDTAKLTLTKSGVGGIQTTLSGTALSISHVKSGGYIILATTGENFIVYRTDHKGKVDVENKPFTFATEFDWVSRESSGSAIGTSDGGYAIFGSSESGGSSMMILIKTDRQGQL